MPPDPHRLSLLARLRVWAAPIMLPARDFCRDCVEDIPLLTRIASHAGLLGLMVLTIAASNIRLGNGDKIENDPVGGSNPDSLFQEADIDGEEYLFSSAIPITTIPSRVRREVVKYTVKSGDTVSGIAEEFGVSADSILWANSKLEDNPDMLSLGQVLNIPPATGVLHTVQAGETVQKIADKYKTTKVTSATLVQNILGLEFNQELHNLKTSDQTLAIGQFLLVPGGVKPYKVTYVSAIGVPIPATAARGTGHFGWPVSGRITQKYWARHTGVDIGAPKGTPVYAADSGFVTYAACEPRGYGCSMLVNHGNGYTTRYAHLSAFTVEVRDSVKKGQLIARVGSTGNSTGPHLHFEIIRNGVQRNPFGLLPAGR